MVGYDGSVMAWDIAEISDCDRGFSELVNVGLNCVRF